MQDLRVLFCNIYNLIHSNVLILIKMLIVMWPFVEKVCLFSRLTLEKLKFKK